MLYTPFRTVLRRYARAVRAFYGHAGPEYLEEPSPEHASFLELLDETRRRVRELRVYFPEVPPGGFDENGPDFGPVLHPDDMHAVVSVFLPLAMSLSEDFPTESYGPVAFLREKCELLAATIEVYVGWRSYTVGQSRPRWNGFASQVPPGSFAGLALVSPKGRHLARLYANLDAGAARCRTAVEFQLGRSVDGL